MIFAENSNLPCRTLRIFPRLPRRLVSLHYRFPNDSALSAKLLVQLFFQVLHLLVELACVIKIPVPFMFATGRQGMALRFFLLCELHADLLLLPFAQKRKRYIRTVREGLQELSQLARFD